MQGEGEGRSQTRKGNGWEVSQKQHEVQGLRLLVLHEPPELVCLLC